MPGVPRAMAARAQLRIGVCFERLGKAEARQAYEAVLRDYSDQPETSREARRRLSALNGVSASPPIPSGPVIRQIVTAQGINSARRSSPDGRHLAFTSMHTSPVEIWTMENIGRPPNGK